MICDNCKKTFKHQQGLNYHIAHGVCLKYSCRCCRQLYKTLAGLRYHYSHTPACSEGKPHVHTSIAQAQTVTTTQTQPQTVTTTQTQPQTVTTTQAPVPHNTATKIKVRPKTIIAFKRKEQPSTDNQLIAQTPNEMVKVHTPDKVPVPVKPRLEFVRTDKYHCYTVPLSQYNIRDLEDHYPNFGEAVFSGYGNVVTNFCELALTSDGLDQHWTHYISNRKDSYVVVYDDEDRWVIKPLRETIKSLTEWAIYMLHQYLSQEGNNEYWTQYLFTMDHLSKEDDPIHREIRRQLFCLLSNLKPKIVAKMDATKLRLKP